MRICDCAVIGDVMGVFGCVGGGGRAPYFLGTFSNELGCAEARAITKARTKGSLLERLYRGDAQQYNTVTQSN